MPHQAQAKSRTRVAQVDPVLPVHETTATGWRTARANTTPGAAPVTALNTPSGATTQDARVAAAVDLRLLRPDRLLGVKEAQEKQPGQVLDVLHDTSAVVVAAQDVARAPDAGGDGVAGLRRPVHGELSQSPRKRTRANELIRVASCASVVINVASGVPASAPKAAS